jgi:hypothetical protein
MERSKSANIAESFIQQGLHGLELAWATISIFKYTLHDYE